ncbi:MAG: hypothetical protein JSW65_00430 [Candidatus Bipolaricaulota bacterium]|nr:MAG: hypothetical protein JSW65_00430 [Candidatus Bipolaricaulota bacterium]
MTARGIFLLAALVVIGGLQASASNCRPGDSDLVEVSVGSRRRTLTLQLPSVALDGLSFAALGSSLSLTIALHHELSVVHRCICRDGATRCPSFVSTELLALVDVLPTGTPGLPALLPDAYEAPGQARLAHVVLAADRESVVVEGSPDGDSCTTLQRVSGTLARGTIEASTVLSIGPVGSSSSSTAVRFEPVLACCCGGEDCGPGSSSSPRFSGLPRSLYFDAFGTARLSFSVHDDDGGHDVERIVVSLVDDGRLPVRGAGSYPVNLSRRPNRVDAVVRIPLTEALVEHTAENGSVWVAVYAEDRCGHHIDGFVEIPENAVLFAHEPPTVSHVLTRSANGDYDIILYVDDPEAADSLVIAASAQAGSIAPPLQVLGAWQRVPSGNHIHLRYIPTCTQRFEAHHVFVAVTDGWGLEASLRIPVPASCSEDPRRRRVPPLPRGGVGNLPPVADAGANVAVGEGERVVLAGSATDPEASERIAYSWRQTCGEPVSLADQETAHPWFVAPEQPPCSSTAYCFDLVATDEAGAQSAPAGVTVTVVDVNHPPVAAASGSAPRSPGGVVVLDGSDSFDPDPGDRVDRCRWLQIGGAPGELSDPSSLRATFVPDDAPRPGGEEHYRFELVVWDRCGERSASAVVDVVLSAGEAALDLRLLVLPPAVARLGEGVTFRAELVNSGSLALHSVWLRTELTGDRFVGTLEPGEWRQLPTTLPHEVTLDDVCDGTVAATGLVNAAWAEAIDAGGSPLESPRATVVVSVAADGRLEVAVEARPEPSMAPGDELEITVLVCNTGDVLAAALRLQVDGVWPPYAFRDLAPGDCVAALDQHVVTSDEAAAGAAVVNARAWGVHPCGCSIDASRSERVLLP